MTQLKSILLNLIFSLIFYQIEYAFPPPMGCHQGKVPPPVKPIADGQVSEERHTAYPGTEEGAKLIGFQVLDEEPGDDEESSEQKQYRLPMRSIIPFPKSDDPSSALDFPPGKHVLAVYPGTTALYKATVVQGHRRVIILSFFLTYWDYFLIFPNSTIFYVLEFDDDEEDGSLPQRTVPFHKVVPLPEGHRQ
ncbi:hypothetical protein RJT34_16355 [Clitoria ternatea]|uniref:SGF29 C-terminal domain-containing protein n=1 Tax=Clitoria ternatea TaxID=43366 RepID=A0AAN9J872_CLITE